MVVTGAQRSPTKLTQSDPPQIATVRDLPRNVGVQRDKPARRGDDDLHARRKLSNRWTRHSARGSLARRAPKRSRHYSHAYRQALEWPCTDGSEKSAGE